MSDKLPFPIECPNCERKIGVDTGVDEDRECTKCGYTVLDEDWNQ